MFEKIDTNTMILVGIILAMITYGIIAYNKKWFPFNEEYYRQLQCSSPQCTCRLEGKKFIKNCCCGSVCESRGSC